MNIDTYFFTSATHHYCIGVEHRGHVTAYLVHLDLNGLRLIFSDKPTQSKRQLVIKYRSNSAKRAYLEEHATQVLDLGTLDAFKASRRVRLNKDGKPYVENCGEYFEYRIAEWFGVAQNELSNLKYTDGGDLVINGIAYQVKYERSGIAIG